MYPRPRMTTRGFARAPFRFECPMQRGLPDCGSDADGRDYETFSSAISVDNLPPSLAPNEAPEFWGSDRAGTPATMASGDRKSTRLNSSHVKISYAVFCL